MALTYYEGPAGTGKTTRLMDALTTRIAEAPLDRGQKVLALTFMHGSRRRLETKLNRIRELDGRFLCQTIDSFAWRIVRRWRDLARQRNLAQDSGGRDYDSTCGTCSQLLSVPFVADWVRHSFPFVVVDELQDCSQVRVSIVAALERATEVFAAADEFQDLNCTPGAPGITWLRATAEAIQLKTNHRTEAAGILRAAGAVRDGRTPLSDLNGGFLIAHGHSTKVAISCVAKSLQWNGVDDAAILCPSSYGNCAFYRHLVDALNAGPTNVTWVTRGTRRRAAFGPYRIAYEKNQTEVENELAAAVALPEATDGGTVDTDMLDLSGDAWGMSYLKSWVRSQRALNGTSFQPSETALRQAISRSVQYLRAYGHNRQAGVRAMTIHQAKNREFANVILLWPYQVVGDKERARRMLYNAITRAKRRCTVIVQGQPSERRIEALFD